MITAATAEDMHEIGVRLSAHLRAGDLVLVNGPLGAGKTVLAQGVGAGLGITGITSPTFVISRVHKATVPFIHVDAYRLIDSDNPNLYLDDLDLDIAGSITLIEWGGAESARPSQDRLEITIDRSDEIRKIEITPVGSRWAGFSL
jgi:tRNA threonylcarbamoyladenosine biosynthesis protein TsaE